MNAPITNETINNWRSQLQPVVDYDFRQAYTTGRLTGRDKTAQGDVVDLVAWWNRCMQMPGKGGKNKIRILDLERFRAIRDCLQVFTADQIALAIGKYSRRDWNLKNGCWKKPNNFFKVGYIRDIVEEHIAETERQQIKKQKLDPRLEKLNKQIAEKTRLKAFEKAIKAQFNELYPQLRRELLERGKAELESLGIRKTFVTPKAIERQALIIFKREQNDESA